MKVRSSVKPICEKCKMIKRKGRSELSVRIRSTSRDRVNSILFNLYENAAEAAYSNPSIRICAINI